MMRKIYALSKFETNIAMDNKFVIIYTLLFPSAYFLYQIFSTAHPVSNEHDIIYNLLGYWGYIIVTGTLNGVISGMLSMRENNFLKMFNYIAGNKSVIFYANLIPQVFIIQLEMLLFNIITLIAYGFNPSIIKFMLITMVANFVLIPIISFFPTFFLALPMKGQSSNILMTGYLFMGLILLGVNSNHNWLNLINSIINPYRYIVDVDSILYNFNGVAGYQIGILILIAIFYILLGNFIVNKMDLRSSTLR